MPKNKITPSQNAASITEVTRIVQASQKEIIEAMGLYSQKVEGKFTKIDERFDKVDERFDKVEQRLTKIESTMVTKDYLNEALSDKLSVKRG